METDPQICFELKRFPHKGMAVAKGDEKAVTVLCGGRFNFPHKGHEHFLRKAKSFGNYLIVIIAHDEHNKKKPNSVDAGKRKVNIKKLGIANKVVIGDPKDFYKVVKKYRPQVIALGWDQKLPFAKNKLKGIKVVKIGRL